MLYRAAFFTDSSASYPLPPAFAAIKIRLRKIAATSVNTDVMRFKTFIEGRLDELSLAGLRKRLLTAKNDPEHKWGEKWIRGKGVSDETKEDLAVMALRMMDINLGGRRMTIRGSESPATDPKSLLKTPQTPQIKPPELPPAAGDPHQ